MKRALISILTRVKGNVNANGTIGALTEIKKFFTTDGEIRVYVSGRCIKYCIKQRLSEKGFDLSPLERPKKVVVSKGNPVLYVDDDLFGFMVIKTSGEVARKRFAPIKTDGIVALRHCEITRDFGGRFDPAEKEMPSPFEVEVTDFIGQNNWILTENIGKFEDKEVEDIIKNIPIKLEEKNENGKKFYYLPTEMSDSANKKYGRKNRLRAFLEVLLKERYIFPRSATGLHQPQYYYAVILLTERLLPLFDHVNYEIKNGKVILNLEKIENLGSMLDEEKMMIIDFEGTLDEEIELRMEKYRNDLEKIQEELKKSSNNKLKEKTEELMKKIKTLESVEIFNSYKINKVIDEITNYLISA